MAIAEADLETGGEASKKVLFGGSGGRLEAEPAFELGGLNFVSPIGLNSIFLPASLGGKGLKSKIPYYRGQQLFTPWIGIAVNNCFKSTESVKDPTMNHNQNCRQSPIGGAFPGQSKHPGKLKSHDLIELWDQEIRKELTKEVSA